MFMFLQVTRPSQRDRVAAGAKWLDKNVFGWEREIDARRLDLGDPCLCMLAQLCGGDDFEGAANQLRLSDARVVQLGFYETPGWTNSFRYWRLTRLWRKEIEARRTLR